MTTKRKIGVFGGTFNPIHIGHLITAEAVREEYGLEKIIFIPAAEPPHKRFGVVSAEHRYNMTALAIMYNPYFCLSDIEMRRKGYSYTIDTIKHLRSEYGEETEFYFIAGTDTIHDLPNWRFIDELLELCHFVGATRPDGSKIINSVIEYFGEIGEKNIHRLETPELEISSTDLRRRLRKGRSVRYMIPLPVIRYIEEHKIYL